MTERSSIPLVGVTSCVRMRAGLPDQTAGDKYLRALARCSDVLPVIVPSMADLIAPDAVLGNVDGLLLTGSPSNVYPEIYGKDVGPESEPHDRDRDAATLPMIRAALEAGLPIFAICRGFQELNVALGGTLHVRVHEVPGRIDHRRPKDPDLDTQYGHRHDISLRKGGKLAQILKCETLAVNSLHWQAIDRLGPRLEVEATAPDGTIEAVSVKDATGFALGVQWHPEYKAWENAASDKLFKAFGEAVRAHAATRAKSILKKPIEAAYA